MLQPIIGRRIARPPPQGMSSGRMERIWLKHYPPGVPAEIDPSRYVSLVDIFAECFRTYRNDGAFVCMDRTLT
jgi:hypothetical protein